MIDPCPDATKSNVPTATAPASPRATTRAVPAPPAPDAVDSAGSRPDPDCRDCHGTGLIRWQQPVPDGRGGMMLREMTHPCVVPGHHPDWRHPAAERGRVVDVPGDAPTRVRGQADAAGALPDALGEQLLALYDRLGDGRHRG